MIRTKHLISALLFFSTLSLFAMDKNDTATIIKEASKATEGLQKDFSELIETKEPIPQTAISTTTDNNVTAQEVIVIEDNVENTTTEEHNETLQEPTVDEHKLEEPTTVIVVEDSVENIATEEHNETLQEPTVDEHKLEEPTTVVIVETNETVQETLEEIPQTSIVNDTSISESNITTIIETNPTLEENQTVAQDTTTEEEEGSFTKGMVIFKTKLKAVCKMTGEEFAKNYTQEDWDDIYDNDEFEKVVYELCPTMKGKYQKKWTKDLYQFSLKYASDSDEIPEC